MVFFKYIFFYILKTTRKYGKNLPGMCGKKLFPGAKYDSRFSWEKMSDCQNFISSKILCYIFWVYAVDWEVKQKSKMKNVKEKKKTSNPFVKTLIGFLLQSQPIRIEIANCSFFLKWRQGAGY